MTNDIQGRIWKCRELIRPGFSQTLCVPLNTGPRIFVFETDVNILIFLFYYSYVYMYICHFDEKL